MAVNYICPEQVFGRGCDFARIADNDHAQLFEVKTCRLTAGDATNTVRKLATTKENLRTRDMVRPSCAFTMWLIHEKTGSCGVDAIASAILEKEKIKLSNYNHPDVNQVYQEYRRRCR